MTDLTQEYQQLQALWHQTASGRPLDYRNARRDGTSRNGEAWRKYRDARDQGRAIHSRLLEIESELGL